MTHGTSIIPMRRISDIKLFIGDNYGTKRALSSDLDDFIIVHSSFQNLKDKLIQYAQMKADKSVTVSLEKIWYRHADGELQFILDDKSYSVLSEKSNLNVWVKFKNSIEPGQNEFVEILESLNHRLTKLEKTVQKHMNQPSHEAAH